MVLLEPSDFIRWAIRLESAATSALRRLRALCLIMPQGATSAHGDTLSQGSSALERPSSRRLLVALRTSPCGPAARAHHLLRQTSSLSQAAAAGRGNGVLAAPRRLNDVGTQPVHGRPRDSRGRCTLHLQGEGVGAIEDQFGLVCGTLSTPGDPTTQKEV